MLTFGVSTFAGGSLSTEAGERGVRRFVADVATVNVRDVDRQRFMPGELQSSKALVSAWNHSSAPPAQQSGRASWPVGVAALRETRRHYRASGETFRTPDAVAASDMWAEIYRTAPELMEWSVFWLAGRTALVEEDGVMGLDLYELQVREVTPTLAGKAADTRTVSLSTDDGQRYAHIHVKPDGSEVGCASLAACVLHQSGGLATSTASERDAYTQLADRLMLLSGRGASMTAARRQQTINEIARQAYNRHQQGR